MHPQAGVIVDLELDPYLIIAEIAAETAKLYLRGVIAMDGRLIGVIDIANLLPATEARRRLKRRGPVTTGTRPRRESGHSYCCAGAC